MDTDTDILISGSSLPSPLQDGILDGPSSCSSLLADDNDENENAAAVRTHGMEIMAMAAVAVAEKEVVTPTEIVHGETERAEVVSPSSGPSENGNDDTPEEPTEESPQPELPDEAGEPQQEDTSDKDLQPMETTMTATREDVVENEEHQFGRSSPSMMEVIRSSSLSSNLFNDDGSTPPEPPQDDTTKDSNDDAQDTTTPAMTNVEEWNATNNNDSRDCDKSHSDNNKDCEITSVLPSTTTTTSEQQPDGSCHSDYSEQQEEPLVEESSPQDDATTSADLQDMDTSTANAEQAEDVINDELALETVTEKETPMEVPLQDDQEDVENDEPVFEAEEEAPMEDDDDENSDKESNRSTRSENQDGSVANVVPEELVVSSSNIDRFDYGLDPAEWIIRTFRGPFTAPMGIYLQRRGVSRVNSNTQADRLGIRPGSKLLTLNGEPVRKSSFRTMLNGRESTLVVAEPRHFHSSSVVRDFTDGGLIVMDHSEIKEVCRQQALRVLTEYDRWIPNNELSLPETNDVVNDVATLMFNTLCSEVADTADEDSTDSSPWGGVPEWMVCDGRFRLIGPQPWMVTRRLAVHCTHQIYEQHRDDLGLWEDVRNRSEWLNETFTNRIRDHLTAIHAAKPKSRMLRSICTAFIKDHAAGCHWYRLTEFYVAACYERWVAQARGVEKDHTTLQAVQYWSKVPCPMDPALETDFRQHMDHLRYKKFPLVADEHWESIVCQAWITFGCRFFTEPMAITENDVVELLDDMEEEMHFLSTSNLALCVRIKSGPFDALLEQGQQPHGLPHLVAASDSGDAIMTDEPPLQEPPLQANSLVSAVPDKEMEGADQDADPVKDGPPAETGDDMMLLDELAALPSSKTSTKKRKSETKAQHKRATSRERESPSKKSKTGKTKSTKNTFERLAPLTRGERVYARWPENGSWYWGYVIRVTPNKKQGYTYGVRFDDGDVLDKVNERMLCSEDEYKLSEFGKAKENESDNESVANGGALSLHQLFVSRCNNCSLCRRKACGNCAACRWKRKPEEICVQKMCCDIQLSSKAQDALLLGDGYKFAFVESDSWESGKGQKLKHTPAFWKGLVLVTPTGNEIHNAASFVQKKWGPEVSRKFFYQIGLDGTRIDLSAAKFKGTMSPRELYEHRCKSCENCNSDDCTRCTSCLANVGALARDRQCCLQKMCCKIELETKSQPAPGFPEGWTFVFDMTSKDYKLRPQYKGLILMAPDGSKFYNVETAIAQLSNGLSSVKPEQFYNKVGLSLTREADPLADELDALDFSSVNSTTDLFDDNGNPFEPDVYVEATSNEPSTEPIADHGGETVLEDDTVPYSPRELYDRACGVCSMCQKDDCGLCHTCIRNQTYTRRYKEVCLRKMCRGIQLLKKAQSAVGFPPDWKFAFCDPCDLSASRQRENNAIAEVRGLCLFRKPNYILGSIQSALRQCKGDTEQFEQFCKFIGASFWRNEAEHALLGGGYCRQWTDVLGRPRIIHGCITKCETHLFDEQHQQFIVAYHQDTAFPYSDIDNVCNLVLPTKEAVSSKWAWGGNYQYRAKAFEPEIPVKPTCPFWTWHIPDQRHECLVANSNGNSTPRLTLVSRRYKLVFNVRPSSIPNAGYGVFVTCTSLALPGEPHTPFFELEPGQFLDLGVYAPFRAEDRKGMHIVILKNFIHSLRCEEWSFDTFDDDFQYDITDDVSGDVHELAMKHIPAYVNECCANQAPNVHAWHDPEGSVHYLLGHESESNGVLRLPADGKTTTEIFVDYGARYEYVRLRKGYSRLPPDEQEVKIHQMERDESEYIREINTFSCSELKDAKEFFSRVFQSAAAFKREEARERALCVAILLKARAQSILNEFATLDVNSESFCDNGITSLDVKGLVRAMGDLILLVCKQWDSPEAIKESMLEKDLFAEVLKEAWKLDDLAGLTPREFLAKVKASK